MAAQKSWKNTRMLAGVTDCRRSQKWGCRGIFAPGFKPVAAATQGRATGSSVRLGETCGFGQVVELCILGWNHAVLGLPLPCSLRSWKTRCSSNAKLSLSSLEECRRDAVGRKRVKALLLVGHEKVSRGFG